MLEETPLRLVSLLKGLAMVLPLVTRGPGRPPVPTDDPAALLLSERRRRIVQLVEEKPGISVLEAEQALDMGAGVFYHHLDKLLTSGILTKRKVGNTAHLYPSGKAPTDPPALASETGRQVAQVVLESPGLTSREIAERLDRPVTTVRGHVKRLLEAGYFEQEQTLTAPTYFPTEKLRGAIRARN